jgi:glycosyltransferase involved in cell wall biosynthesis
VGEGPNGSKYPEEVVFSVAAANLREYRAAAEYINLSGADVAFVQHEHGIFGGTAGGYIVELLNNLRKPVISTLHTVQSSPQEPYRSALLDVARASDAVVGMTPKAVELLRDVYGIAADKIHMIHHGIPDVPFLDTAHYKPQFGVEGRTVLMTFGLLSPNKGIEHMLDALPQIVAAHPEVTYIVLGATHPEVKKQRGEEYRLSLERRARSLGISEHVIFHDRFVTLPELCEFLGACDIYITPYLNLEQIVSGTLAYAVGTGKAIVSTPYWYARDLLAEGRGRIVEFADSESLAQTVLDLLENDAEREAMRERAYAYGRQMIWREVGRQYIGLGREIKKRAMPRVSVTPTRITHLWKQPLPEVNLNHLIRLTDDTGVIQHAVFRTPDRQYGYSTDDIGRALVVAMLHSQQFGGRESQPLAERYLAFLRHAQREDGLFHNYMDYGRRFTDDVGSEDTQGIALWGLGTAVQLGQDEEFRAVARTIFERALTTPPPTAAMAIAYYICGLCAFLDRYEGATRVRERLREMEDALVALHAAHRRDGWQWFGDTITYGAAKPCHALLLASGITGSSVHRTVGLETLDFLTSVQLQDGRFEPIGNNGWYPQGGERAIFDQQPIDAAYLVEAYLAAFDSTGGEQYLENALTAFEWFLGRNRNGVPMYDFTDGSCLDGLTPEGGNLNRGAESTICCLLALLTLRSGGASRIIL